MNQSELLQLLGEKSAIQRMIAETSEEDVLDRASLSARLRTIQGALSEVRPDEPATARAEQKKRGK